MNIENKYWGDKVASKIIHENKGKKKLICAAGITPSGTVHIGNFRDIITSEIISKALKQKNKNSKVMFFWDDYDRLRKIPKGINQEFSKYTGKPISGVPDPYSCHKSYAQHFEKEFEQIMEELGIEVEFIYQEREYKKNEYHKEIKTALQKRKEIGKILSEFKTQGMKKEEIDNFYPYQVYCEKCGKDTTKIKEYDGEENITYTCKCGYENKVDISKKNVGKLVWKVDWAARWKHYNINFEPGGQDHATQGGSYDISKKIAKEIYNINAPVFKGYAFVGIKGIVKMSSSSGTGISPKDLLEIYEPELLRWIFTRVKPKSKITFCFDSELIRQYDEFDKEIRKYLEKNLEKTRERALELAKTSKEKFLKNRVSFRQIATFGQIAQENFNELKKMFKRMNQKFDEDNLKIRLEKSENWVKKFVPELHIKVREKPNKKYFKSLSKEEQSEIIKLRTNINKNWDLKKLTSLVYEIPKKQDIEEKENKKRQRRFFKNMYQMLINNDTGPRLPTFLLALGKEKVKKLLKSS